MSSYSEYLNRQKQRLPNYIDTRPHRDASHQTEIVKRIAASLVQDSQNPRSAAVIVLNGPSTQVRSFYAKGHTVQDTTLFEAYEAGQAVAQGELPRNAKAPQIQGVCYSSSVVREKQNTLALYPDEAAKQLAKNSFNNCCRLCGEPTQMAGTCIYCPVGGSGSGGGGGAPAPAPAPAPVFTRLQLTNDGNNDVYIAKYNTDGGLNWVAKIGGSLGEDLNNISTDSSGNLYVIGLYDSTPVSLYNSNGTPYGTLSLLSASDGFMVKYDSSGFIQWTSRFTGDNSLDAPLSIAVDSGFNIYVSGYFNSTTLNVFNANSATFTSVSPPSGGVAAFLVKFNSSGVVQWATTMDGTSTEGFRSIDVDANGNIYAAGFSSSTTNTVFSVGGTAFSSFSGLGGNDAFIVKYNSSGIVQWVSRVAGTAGDSGFAVKTDSTGDNIYITGPFSSTVLTVYSSNGNTFTTLNNLGASGSDAFLVKYNTNGIAQWAVRIGGTGADSGDNISVDPSGNVYIAGYFGSPTLTIYNQNNSVYDILTQDGSDDGFILKYDTNGNLLWKAKIGGSSGQTLFRVAVDSNSNVYVVGDFGNSSIVYNANGTPFTTLSGGAATDAFVVKYNSSGTALWASRVSGTGTDLGRGLSVDPNGNVFISGRYASNPITIYSQGL